MRKCLQWVLKAKSLSNLGLVNGCPIFHHFCNPFLLTLLKINIPKWPTKNQINIISTFMHIRRYLNQQTLHAICNTTPNHNTFSSRLKCWNQEPFLISLSRFLPYCALPWLLPKLNWCLICPNEAFPVSYCQCHMFPCPFLPFWMWSLFRNGFLAAIWWVMFRQVFKTSWTVVLMIEEGRERLRLEVIFWRAWCRSCMIL